MKRDEGCKLLVEQSWWPCKRREDKWFRKMANLPKFGKDWKIARVIKSSKTSPRGSASVREDARKGREGRHDAENINCIVRQQMATEKMCRKHSSKKKSCNGSGQSAGVMSWLRQEAGISIKTWCSTPKTPKQQFDVWTCFAKHQGEVEMVAYNMKQSSRDGAGAQNIFQKKNRVESTVLTPVRWA